MMHLNQQQQQPLVSFAAVFLDLTQRSPQDKKGKEFGAGLSSRFFGGRRCVTSKKRLRKNSLK